MDRLHDIVSGVTIFLLGFIVGANYGIWRAKRLMIAVIENVMGGMKEDRNG